MRKFQPSACGSHTSLVVSIRLLYSTH